jgi:HK97 family phage portal protein
MSKFTRALARPFRSLRERKISATSRVIASGGSGTSAQWTEKRFDLFAKESYLTNVVAFRCISEVARCVAMVPWEVRRTLKDGNTEAYEKHPFTEVLKRPNPDDSFPFLMVRIASFLQIAGNAYIERVGPETGPNGGSAKELYVLRPDRVRVEVDNATGRIGGYTYEVGGKKETFKIDPLSGRGPILQLKQLHPLDDWYGAGNIEPTAREIDTSNEAITWNKKLLENECRPGMLVTIIGDQAFQVTDQQLDDVEKKLKQKFLGKAGKNLVLTGARGTDAKPYGFSPLEMDWDKGDDRIARRICMGFGVPPMLVGIPGEATFANFKEARLHFWENTILWFLEYFKQELNNWLFFEETDTKLAYKLDDVAALAERRESIWKRAQESIFLTVNEQREMVGYDPVPEGDVVLIAATQIALGETPAQDEPPIDTEDSNVNPQKMDTELKEIVLTAVEKALEKKEESAESFRQAVPSRLQTMENAEGSDKDFQEKLEGKLQILERDTNRVSNRLEQFLSYVFSKNNDPPIHVEVNPPQINLTPEIRIVDGRDERLSKRIQIERSKDGRISSAEIIVDGRDERPSKRILFEREKDGKISGAEVVSTEE